MALYMRPDPGPCPVDQAPHTTCTSDSGPIVIPQMPMRDGVEAPPLVGGAMVPRLVGQVPTHPELEGEVTTSTYRRKRR